MQQATPAIRDLARRLLAEEAGESEQVEITSHTASRACEKLRLHLTKLVGAAGFQAILSRALALAKPEAVWLKAVRVEADARLEGFNEAAQHLPADVAAAGGEALLAQLLGLLITFIGEALTLRLVREMWPQAQIDAMNLGAEETS